jgi:enoyl-CoA hydratase/carnithine racemase
MSIEARDEHGGRVRKLVFQRPEKKNALTVAMYASLASELAAAKESSRVRAVVITGAGAAFTAGNDIQDFIADPPVTDDSAVVRFLLELARFPKPVVAAVPGVAIGVGTTMLLHCDRVIAARSARFQLPFVKLGLCPEGGSSLLLPEIVGWQRASELILWGEPFDAETAHRLGIVNDLVPDEELAARVDAVLERIIELSPEAVAASKALLRAPVHDRVEAAMRREAEVFRERLGSAEAAEAFRAFFEKRKPQFG